MKKIAIAAALLTAFAAHAQITGGTTNGTIVQVGASTVNAGPHTSGKAGVGTDGVQKVDLGGIGLFTLKGFTGSFSRHQLLGYTHQDLDNGGDIVTNFNWFKVPTVSTEVYFGIATKTGTTPQHAAFYVGDRSGYAVPGSTTNYTAVALLATPSTAASTPTVLSGNLRYDASAGTLNSANASTGANQALSGSGTTLQINSTVNVAAGTFAATGTGTSTVGASLNGGSRAGSVVSGQFYGSGASSSVAGTVVGTGYVAAIGGLKN